MRSATRVASAMIVSDGFTDNVRGMSDESPTKSRLTSCDSPLRSTTDRVGSSPIRQLPWTCVDASPVQQICFAPAASSTLRLKSSDASSPLRLDRLEADVEALAAPLVHDHGRAVLVVDECEQPDPVAKAPHCLDEPRPPERPLLVPERRREADRILDRRCLDDEAALLVVLEVHAVGGDRVDHVRILRLVEEPVDETHRVQAEVPTDVRVVDAAADE